MGKSQITDHSSVAASAENYAKSLGAKVTLLKFHATASRFPTRESMNLFIKFLGERDYNFRLDYSVASSIAFSLKPASLELRKLANADDFHLGSLS